MNGGTFTDYKNIILSKMLQNENLLKALTNNQSDFLVHPLLISPPDIIYNYIYPYRIHPDIITDVKSFITMEFVNFRPTTGNQFKSGKVYFYTICHESLVVTDFGNRYDYIYNELFSIFHENTQLGIGKPIIVDTSDLSVSKDYMGNVCCLEIVDFQ